MTLNRRAEPEEDWHHEIEKQRRRHRNFESKVDLPKPTLSFVKLSSTISYSMTDPIVSVVYTQ